MTLSRVTQAALTPANYVFEERGAQADGLTLLTMTPKRKDVMLVEGRMVLNANNGDLLRVEGKLSKNPSFWTSLVNVIRHFAKLDGVRVPVSTESVAKVKFAGQSRLDVFYQYESINGRPVSVAARRASTGRRRDPCPAAPSSSASISFSRSRTVFG